MNLFRNGTIGGVYVIHARHLTERATHMERQLGSLDIPFEFVDVHDAAAIDPELRRRWVVPDYKYSNNKLSCTLNHLEALQRIAARGHRLALVLEDDVVLAGGFHEELSKIVEESKDFAPPYTIQIGCANNMYVPRKLLRPGQRLYEAHEVRANDSCLIGAETARVRLDWLKDHKVYLPTDHMYNLIDRDKGIRCYWSEPTIVVQGSANGSFASSLDAAHWSRPLWYFRVRFAWKRLRKRHLGRLFQ